MAYVRDVIDPFVHMFCDKAQLEGSPWKEYGILPYGEQKALLSWDTWWAQRHRNLTAYLDKNYSYFLRSYVPGSCTGANTAAGIKAAQWSDAGPISFLKATTRGFQSQRTMEHVVEELQHTAL